MLDADLDKYFNVAILLAAEAGEVAFLKLNFLSLMKNTLMYILTNETGLFNCY